MGAGLKMGGSLLNRIGNPLVIPKPLICIEPENMNGFEELFFPLFTTQPRSIRPQLTEGGIRVSTERQGYLLMTFFYTALKL